MEGGWDSGDADGAPLVGGRREHGGRGAPPKLGEAAEGGGGDARGSREHVAQRLLVDEQAERGLHVGALVAGRLHHPRAGGRGGGAYAGPRPVWLPLARHDDVALAQVPDAQPPVLPHRHDAVAADRGHPRHGVRVQHAHGGVEGDGRHPRVVPLALGHRAAVPHVPHHDEVVLAARHEVEVVGGPCRAEHRAVLGADGEEQLLRGEVEDSDEAVVARQRHHLAVGGEGDVVDGPPPHQPAREGVGLAALGVRDAHPVAAALARVGAAAGAFVGPVVLVLVQHEQHAVAKGRHKLRGAGRRPLDVHEPRVVELPPRVELAPHRQGDAVYEQQLPVLQADHDVEVLERGGARVDGAARQVRRQPLLPLVHVGGEGAEVEHAQQVARGQRQVLHPGPLVRRPQPQWRARGPRRLAVAGQPAAGPARGLRGLCGRGGALGEAEAALGLGRGGAWRPRRSYA
mmetsp:Transcript_71270/g.190278  ORF Transcript_71270/g.190278 Transcript_71270/m.190278 type:complete len:458 (+) Transcript_71270:72-1445(+)